MLTNQIDFTGKVAIGDELTTKIYIDDFSFNVAGITDSSIGENVHIKTFQVLINIANKLIKNLINAAMREGISL